MASATLVNRASLDLRSLLPTDTNNTPVVRFVRKWAAREVLPQPGAPWKMRKMA